MSLTPALFTSAASDASDATKLRPSNWNRVTGLLDSLLNGADAHGSLLYRNTGDVTDGASWLAPGAVGTVLAGAGAAPPAFTATPSVTSLTLGTPLGAASGGTGFGSFAIGDQFYASSANAISKLAAVAAGSFMRSAGVATAPVWSTATWPNTAVAGDLLYASGTNAYANLAVGAAGTVLVGGSAPAWSATPSLTSLTLGAAGSLAWSTDLFLVRDTANALAQRNSTTAQTFRVYRNFTDASNYGRLAFQFNSNDARIGTEGLGTISPGDLYLGAAGTYGIRVKASDGGLTLTVPLTLVGGTLLSTGTALTNGAAAQTGTLTNAPTAGNPTKWIPISDNGTTRYIPAW